MAWGDQAAIANNDAIKMLTKMLPMTRTKDGPEFPGDYSSAKALERIAAALERLAGAPAPCDFSAADAFVFAAGTATLVPVPRVNRVDIGLLRGIDQARDILLGNTERFAQGFAANNALLWAPAAWANPRSSKLCMQQSMRGLPLLSSRGRWRAASPYGAVARPAMAVHCL